MKTTIYNQIYDYLKIHPDARERANRYKAIRALLRRKYSIPENITNDLIELIITEGITCNRFFNKVMQDNIELRGKDYDEKKKILQQQAQIDLGYTSGYFQDIKKLKKLS